MRGFRRKCGVNWLREGTEQQVVVDDTAYKTELVKRLEGHRVIEPGDFQYTRVETLASQTYFDKLPEHWNRVKPVLLGIRS